MKTRVAMFNMLAGVSGIVVLFLLLSGCGGEKKVDLIPVGAMEDYRDPVLGFHISHPQGWIFDVEAGRRARFFSTQGVKERFLDPLGQYPDGAMIGIDVIRTTAPDSAQKAILADLAKVGYVLKPEQPATIGGKQGVKVPYLANFGNKIIVYGDQMFFQADTLLYNVVVAGFSGLFEAHRAVFDSSLKTFEFPKPAVKGADPTLPSESMTAYDGKLFSFSYPDNFNSTNPPKGTSELVVELRGVRQDCSIRFDVFPAKGLTAQKVMDQNLGRYKPTAKGQMTIGGQPAPHFTYPAAKDVERRFCFVVKDDKVYRFTMDWFRPQRDQYLAAYDKVLGSFKFK